MSRYFDNIAFYLERTTSHASSNVDKFSLYIKSGTGKADQINLKKKLQAANVP